MLDPDKLKNEDIRLHLGELTPEQCRTARAAIRWANSVRDSRIANPKITPSLRAKLSARVAMDNCNKGDTLAALYAIAQTLCDLADALDGEIVGVEK